MHHFLLAASLNQVNANNAMASFKAFFVKMSQIGLPVLVLGGAAIHFLVSRRLIPIHLWVIPFLFGAAVVAVFWLPEVTSKYHTLIDSGLWILAIGGLVLLIKEMRSKG